MDEPDRHVELRPPPPGRVTVVLAAVATAMVAVAYRRFPRDLPPASLRRLVIAAVLYVAGAAGMELFTAAHEESHGAHGMTIALLTTVEESLEMAGSIVARDALLAHLPSELRASDVRPKAAGGTASAPRPWRSPHHRARPARPGRHR